MSNAKFCSYNEKEIIYINVENATFVGNAGGSKLKPNKTVGKLETLLVGARVHLQKNGSLLPRRRK